MHKNDKVLFFNELCLVLRQRNIFFELKSRQRNIRRKEKRIAFAVRLVSSCCCKAYRGRVSMVRASYARSAFLRASSTVSAVARITAMRRWPTTSGLPKMRI